MTLVIYHNGRQLGLRRFIGYSKREACAKMRKHFGLTGKRNVEIVVLL